MWQPPMFKNQVYTLSASVFLGMLTLSLVLASRSTSFMTGELLRSKMIVVVKESIFLLGDLVLWGTSALFYFKSNSVLKYSESNSTQLRDILSKSEWMD